MIHEPLKVLLIEDVRDDERLALRAIRRCRVPVLVRVARDGEWALRLLGIDGAHRRSPLWIPDLVISDLKMPKLHGDEVVRLVRAEERLRDVPFVMFSSSDDPADIQRCLALGANDYVTKPLEFATYAERVSEIADRWLSEAYDRALARRT